MKTNHDLFFLMRPDGTIAWDFMRHLQFQLSREFLERFLALTENPELFDTGNNIDRTLYANGLVQSTENHPDAEVNWGWDILSRIYHFGTKDIPYDSTPSDVSGWAQLYLEHCQHTLKHAPPVENHGATEGRELKLPPPDKEMKSLFNSLTKRKTCRAFEDNSIQLTDISTILYFSLGYLKEREDQVDPLVPTRFRHRRSSPSGGGLNATEGYLYAKNVQGLEPGIYYYNPKNHSLVPRAIGVQTRLGELVSGQHFADEIPFGVFLTARLDKLWWKYKHSRAYRMALIEIGHVAQSLQLVCTDRGFGTWPTGALAETLLESMGVLYSPHEQVLFFVGAGQTQGDGIPSSIRRALDTERQQHG